MRSIASLFFLISALRYQSLEKQGKCSESGVLFLVCESFLSEAKNAEVMTDNAGALCVSCWLMKRDFYTTTKYNYENK